MLAKMPLINAKKALHSMYSYLVDGIGKHCMGESKEHMEMLCRHLPETNCITGQDSKVAVCTYEEFNCGNGQCIPSETLCDNNYNCRNGADELQW